MSDRRAALIWCPFPDRVSAKKVARQLLAQKLIACANIVPAIESVFEYEGRCESETECGVLFKTVEDSLGDAIARLGELHPYDTPAIVGWHCDAAHDATLDWLTATTTTGD